MEYGHNISLSLSLSELIIVMIIQAQQNMKHDWNGSDFDTVVSSAENIWNKTLSQVLQIMYVRE